MSKKKSLVPFIALLIVLQYIILYNHYWDAINRSKNVPEIPIEEHDIPMLNASLIATVKEFVPFKTLPRWTLPRVILNVTNVGDKPAYNVTIYVTSVMYCKSSGASIMLTNSTSFKKMMIYGNATIPIINGHETILLDVEMDLEVPIAYIKNSNYGYTLYINNTSIEYDYK